MNLSRDLRARLSLTQAQAARLWGVTRRQIARWESGKGRDRPDSGILAEVWERLAERDGQLPFEPDDLNDPTRRLLALARLIEYAAEGDAAQAPPKRPRRKQAAPTPADEGGAMDDDTAPRLVFGQWAGSSCGPAGWTPKRNGHALIVGPSGVGKTVAAVAAADAARRDGLAPVVLDVGGDWVPRAAGLGLPVIDPFDPAGGVNLADPGSGVPAGLGPSIVADWLTAAAGLGARQAGAVRTAVEDALKAGEGHAGVIRRLPDRAGLQDRLGVLASIWPGAALGSRGAEDLLKTGAVIDLSAVPDAARTLVSALLLAALFRAARTRQGPLRNIVIAEEAHRYKGRTLIRLVESMLREARKYGLGVWLVTQSRRDLPTEVTEQAAAVLELGPVRGAGRLAVDGGRPRELTITPADIPEPSRWDALAGRWDRAQRNRAVLPPSERRAPLSVGGAPGSGTSADGRAWVVDKRGRLSPGATQESLLAILNRGD